MSFYAARMFPQEHAAFKDHDRDNRYIRNCPIDHREEFAEGEDFVNRVEFSPHVAELQPMFWEEPVAMIPFVAVPINLFPDGVVR